MHNVRSHIHKRYPCGAQDRPEIVYKELLCIFRIRLLPCTIVKIRYENKQAQINVQTNQAKMIQSYNNIIINRTGQTKAYIGHIDVLFVKMIG